MRISLGTETPGTQRESHKCGLKSPSRCEYSIPIPDIDQTCEKPPLRLPLSSLKSEIGETWNVLIFGLSDESLRWHFTQIEQQQLSHCWTSNLNFPVGKGVENSESLKFPAPKQGRWGRGDGKVLHCGNLQWNRIGSDVPFPSRWSELKNCSKKEKDRFY